MQERFSCDFKARDFTRVLLLTTCAVGRSLSYLPVAAGSLGVRGAPYRDFLPIYMTFSKGFFQSNKWAGSGLPG